MRNRLLESKRDIFLYQAAILRSQSGRKLNARDYRSVVNAHHQSTSVYDDPEAIVRTARHAEAQAAAMDECDPEGGKSVSINTATDQVKKPKTGCSRPRLKGHRPCQSSSVSLANAAQARKSSQSTENPYAKPTYRSFEWLLPTRRRSSAGTDDMSSTDVKRKRRRKLFGSHALSSPGDSLVNVENEDCTNSGSVDFGTGQLFLDVTGNDAGQSQEPSMITLPGEDRTLDDEESRRHLAGIVSSQKDKSTESVNGVVSATNGSVSPAGELHISTPLKRSPLHLFEETGACKHISTMLQSSPNFDISKLQARHFSDILVDRVSPAGASRNRTVSQNSEDAYIDVVSDAPVPCSSVNSQPSVSSQPPVCNGFADGLSRLSKVKTKKRLTFGGLVNGLQQTTLDSFLRRVPNGSHCPNGIDNVVETVARTENKDHDRKQSSSPSSVKLTKISADRLTETDETSDKNVSLMDRTVDGDDNVVDMDSIEGVWRRRTSLRSSTAFLNLLGPDLDAFT